MQGDIDIGLDINVDMNLDMAVSINFGGSFMGDPWESLGSPYLRVPFIWGQFQDSLTQPWTIPSGEFSAGACIEDLYTWHIT